MSFNPVQTKEEQILSRKKNAATHPLLFFNNSEIKLSSNQKHLGLTLESKLSFNKHINDKIHQDTIINPLSADFTKWSNTLKQFVCNLLMNCLSVFDHFVGLRKAIF